MLDPSVSPVDRPGEGYPDGRQMVAALTDSWGTGTEPDRQVWFEFRIHTN